MQRVRSKVSPRTGRNRERIESIFSDPDNPNVPRGDVAFAKFYQGITRLFTVGKTVDEAKGVLQCSVM